MGARRTSTGPAERPRRRFGRVRELPSGRFQAGYVAPDGTTCRADTTFPTRAAAERWLSVTEADLLRGEWTDPRRRQETVGEWAARWLATGQWSPKTVAWHHYLVRVHINPKWKATPVGDVTREEIRAWAAALTSKGLAPQTMRHIVGILTRVLGAATEAGVIPSNPATRLRLPSTSPTIEMHVLAPAETERLAEAIARPALRTAGNGAQPTARPFRPDLSLWVRLAAYCGLRAGEIAALRRGQIDLDRSRILITQSLADVGGHLSFGGTKTRRPRTVPIPNSLIPDLMAHLDTEVSPGQNALLFTDRNGGPIRHGALYSRHFKPAVRRAGLPPDLRFHDLRHSFAALLIAEGAHPRAIMERLGHSSITVTLNTYGHLFPSLESSLTADLDRTITTAQQNRYCTYVARPPQPGEEPEPKEPTD